MSGFHLAVNLDLHILGDSLGIDGHREKDISLTCLEDRICTYGDKSFRSRLIVGSVGLVVCGDKVVVNLEIDCEVDARDGLVDAYGDVHSLRSRLRLPLVSAAEECLLCSDCRSHEVEDEHLSSFVHFKIVRTESHRDAILVCRLLLHESGNLGNIP